MALRTTEKSLRLSFRWMSILMVLASLVVLPTRVMAQEPDNATDAWLGEYFTNRDLLGMPSLLRYEDRNSMAHSVESRLPLLDYRMVELGLALPTAMKLRRGWGKWILRRAVGLRLPRAIAWARCKHGFSAPQNAWIDRGLGRLIRRMLSRRRVAVRAWLPRGASLDELFCDERLKHRGATLAEATALLWLAGHEPTEMVEMKRPFCHRETIFAEVG